MKQRIIAVNRYYAPITAATAQLFEDYLFGPQRGCQVLILTAPSPTNWALFAISTTMIA